MKKIFKYASMMLCALAMTAITSCGDDSTSPNVFNWRVDNRNTACNSSIMVDKNGNPTYTDENCLDNAKKYLEDKFNAAMSLYSGSITGFKTLEEMKTTAKATEAESKILNLVNELNSYIKTHDFGPVNLGYAASFILESNGNTIYRSKEISYGIYNNIRLYYADKLLIQRQVSSVMSNGFRLVKSSDLFDSNVVDIDNIEYDYDNAKIYDETTHDLYTGEAFASAKKNGIDGFEISYSAKTVGSWYMLLPAKVTLKGSTTDTATYDVMIKFNFTK